MSNLNADFFKFSFFEQFFISTVVNKDLIFYSIDCGSF
mgnify:CR=1 FL=1